MDPTPGQLTPLRLVVVAAVAIVAIFVAQSYFSHLTTVDNRNIESKAVVSLAEQLPADVEALREGFKPEADRFIKVFEKSQARAEHTLKKVSDRYIRAAERSQGTYR